MFLCDFTSVVLLQNVNKKNNWKFRHVSLSRKEWSQARQRRKDKIQMEIKASQNGQLYSGPQRVHPTNPDKFGFRFCSWHLLFSNKKRWNLSETCVCNEPPHGYMFIYYTGDTVNTMKTHMFNLTEMFIHVSWENRLYLYQTCKPTALESF